jgi:ribosomal protein S18 acetylase RimI-like enzyme
MAVIYQQGDYRIESLSHEEIKKLFVPLFDEVFAEFSSFDMAGFADEKKTKLLNEKSASLYRLNLALFYRDEFVGWSVGRQTEDNRFYMQNSGVKKEFRRKGLYSLLLDQTLQITKREGFLEVFSCHITTNNDILIAKLKKGFFISGMQMMPRFGMTAVLTFCHHRELQMMFDYRSGRILNKEIQNRLQR